MFSHEAKIEWISDFLSLRLSVQSDSIGSCFIYQKFMFYVLPEIYVLMFYPPEIYVFGNIRISM